jgi:uncharacterized protein (DUF433 family)
VRGDTGASRAGNGSPLNWPLASENHCKQAFRTPTCNRDDQEIITVEPGKRSGKPCIRGLRITVSDILEYLASGMSNEEILADFPERTIDDITARLAYIAPN